MLQRSRMIPEDNRGMKRWNFCGACSLKVLKLSNRSKKKSTPGLAWPTIRRAAAELKVVKRKVGGPKKNHIGSGVCQKKPKVFPFLKVYG